MLVKDVEDSPDRRFWTAYDHFQFEREARALRRQHMYALLARARQAVLRNVRAALKNAGAQPSKARRTGPAGA
jgi:hypothetical protein